MPSGAYADFAKNAGDVERLLVLHAETGGSAPGRRQGLEVLNKAGIVLVCAMWEAYCEDVCREGVYRLLRNAQKTNEPRKQLPKELLKIVVAAIGRDKNELAMWGLAGKSWFSTTYVAVDESLVDRFHTPNADEVDGLFEKALGL